MALRAALFLYIPFSLAATSGSHLLLRRLCSIVKNQGHRGRFLRRPKDDHYGSVMFIEVSSDSRYIEPRYLLCVSMLPQSSSTVRTLQECNNRHCACRLTSGAAPDDPHCLLKKRAYAMRPAKHQRVQSFTHRKNKYVVKYRQTTSPRYLRSWAASTACALMFEEFVRPARLRAGDIEHEAARLRTLHRQGVRVPQVVTQTADFLILEHCGNNLARLVKHAQPDTRTGILKRVIDDLAEFHRAGHWHGGAQLRNLTLQQDEIYRIDFEESVGMALPRELAQAYDLVLTFHSMADYLGHHGELGPALLSRYFQRGPAPEVRIAA